MGTDSPAGRAERAHAAAAFDSMDAYLARPALPKHEVALLDARAAILRAFAAAWRGDRITLAVALERFRAECEAAGIDVDAQPEAEQVAA